MKDNCNIAHDVYVYVFPSTSCCPLRILPLLIIFLSSFSLSITRLFLFFNSPLPSTATYTRGSLQSERWHFASKCAAKIASVSQEKKKRGKEEDGLDYFSHAARVIWYSEIYAERNRLTDWLAFRRKDIRRLNICTPGRFNILTPFCTHTQTV